jgi:hypothetical protein
VVVSTLVHRCSDGWSWHLGHYGRDRSCAALEVRIDGELYAGWLSFGESASRRLSTCEDQHWAEPDLDEATGRMIALIDNPETGRELGALGSDSIRLRFSYSAAGLRYLQRLIELQKRISGATFSCKIRAPGDF